MTQTTVFVDRRLTEQELTAGLAAAFEIAPADVRLLNDIAELADNSIADLRLACVGTSGGEHFPLLLDCYALDRGLIELDEMTQARKFCAATGACCALSLPDNEIDEMWLVAAHGEPTLIDIDFDSTGAQPYAVAATTAVSALVA